MTPDTLEAAVGTPYGPSSQYQERTLVSTMAAEVASALRMASVYFIENATNNPPDALSAETVSVSHDHPAK